MRVINPLVGFNGFDTLTDSEKIEWLQAKVDRLEQENKEMKIAIAEELGQ